MHSSGWAFDSGQMLGRGGFGRVYAASGPNGQSLAAKVIPKAPGAARELLGEALPPSPHIVPILHVEESSDTYVLYMPLGERSLRDRMDDAPLSTPESLEILRQVASGLRDLSPHVVHRDLKPENVLFVDGHWAICDFGISRYVDASTDTDTQKWSMTPPYAAPEQWRHVRATGATDVYALGVIAYELLSGSRPFPGPGKEQYRHQHLQEVPARFPTTRRLSSLIDECLFKAPEARPSVENFLLRIKRAEADAAAPGASALADAQQAVIEERAAQHAANEAARTETERRGLLEGAAMRIFEGIREELVEQIEDVAPAADVRRYLDRVEIQLGQASLTIQTPQPWHSRGQLFDVIAFGTIHLEGLRQGLTRRHSLYYANLADPEQYQWFELAFCGMFGNVNFDHQPLALNPGEAEEALGPGMGVWQLAYGINQLVPGDVDEFVDSWSRRFGEAAVGKFPRPSQLPEAATGRLRAR